MMTTERLAEIEQVVADFEKAPKGVNNCGVFAAYAARVLPELIARYRTLEEVSVNELVEMSKDLANLRRLVERVVELGPSLQAGSVADVIYGKTANTEKLIQLLDDCKQALEAGE